MCPSTASQVPALFDLMPPYTIFWTMIPFILLLVCVPFAGVRKAIRQFRRFSREHTPSILRWVEGAYNLCFLANFVLSIFLAAWAILLFEWSTNSPAYKGCSAYPLVFGLKAHPEAAGWLIVAALVGVGLSLLRKQYPTLARRWANGSKTQERA